MKVRGFTLIELMIVVAVVAILAAIAVPTYNRQVEQTRRADAKAGLLDAAQRLERCFTRNNTYANCLDSPFNSPDNFYTITVAEPAGGNLNTGFLLTATAVGADACSPFTLNDRGVRGSNPGGTRCGWN